MVNINTDKQQLISEMKALHRRMTELEKQASSYRQEIESLREIDEKYRTTFESANDILILISKSGKILDVNKKLKDIGGYKREELIGKNLKSLTKMMTKESLAIVLKNFMKRMVGINIRPYEVEMIRRDGKLITVEISAVAMRVNDKIVGDLAILRDITERKRAEHDLNLRMKELMCLYSITDIAQRQDVGLDELYQEAVRLLPGGWQYSEITCARIKLGDKVFKTANFKITEWQQIADINIKQNKEGTVEVFYLEARPELDEGPFLKEERLLIDAVARRLGDVTERKWAEDALRKTEWQLRQSQKMEAIGHLAGGIAHDFNNLLTVITVCSDMLLANIDENDSSHQDVEEISKAAERAAMLTKQLLLFSRRQVLEPSVLNVNSIVDEMDKLLHRLVGENIQLVSILGADLDLVKVDAGGMEQVIMNLVINARDAMPMGGKITIKTEKVKLDEKDSLGISEARAGDFVRLSVEDTGIGMSKETMEHIFEPFFTTKNRGKGTGLGLSTVYGIIKQSGGWINVYSELGSNSTFNIYLPVFNTGSEGERKQFGKDSTLKELSGNGERILLVEDEAPIRSVAERLLNENGYRVFATESVEEALAVFNRENGNFQLVLSDVVLSDRSGIELVDQLHMIKPGLPVVLSSGYADEKSQRSVIRRKRYPFVQKPYTTEKLLRTINEIIGSAKERIITGL